FLLFAGFALLCIQYRRSPALYAGVVGALIIAMIVEPLVHTTQAAAFQDRQLVQQAEQQRAAADETEKQNALDELQNRDFNPFVNPLEIINNQFSIGNGQGDESAPQSPTQQITNPLSPAASVQSQLDVIAATACTVDGETDTDCDGLSDTVEATKLDTWDFAVDTDGDGISDSTEVAGFFLGTQWYLDPNAADSNGDGLTDGAECADLLDVNEDDTLGTATGTTCVDTDGDGVPDVFDFDNDGDGVPDSVDSAPNYVDALSSAAQSEFDLTLSGFDDTTSRNLVVDLEVRPTIADHLYQSYNVLDWPDDDTEGQITRVYNTTLADEGYDSTGTDQGDMMLVPMLEITIPAPDDNPDNPSGGLPILASYSGEITNAVDLATWLDTDLLDEYSISVTQDDDDGTLYAYIALSQIEDATGEAPVAWGAQMLYRPDGADWGENHQVRMVWLVQALTDSCDTTAMTDNDDEDVWCASDSENWTTELTVIQSYYEEFYLTGLTVTEDYGFDVAVLSQANALSVTYENYLWHLANSLSSSFGEGNLLAADTRFDLAEVVDRFGAGSSYSTGDAQLWDIPANSFYSESNTYDDEVSALEALVDTLIPDLLANYSAGTDDTVSILLAQEANYRTIALGSDSGVAWDSATGTLALDLTDRAQQTYTTLSLTPYEYDGSDWSAADIYDYLDALEVTLEGIITTAAVDELLAWFSETQEYSSLDTIAQQGVISLARNFYFTLYAATSALVDDTDLGLFSDIVVDDDMLTLDFNGDGSADDAYIVVIIDTLGMVQTYYLLEEDSSLDEMTELLIT
ncbi:MAG: thrombospondin type 3 repeat-containing protein, partial [Caldilineaceae bacterium]|nr:thrombospondin type 3 repeat-containing protein [Caldilineaceae bacterium]